MHTRRTTLCIVVALAWSCAGSVTGVDRGPGSVASIDLIPSSVTLAVGAEAPLQATVRDESGRALTGVPLVWSVRDTAIARISPTGVVTARRVGNTQIAASAGGVSAIATLTVQPPPVASVVVQPLSRTLVLGESATFAATPRDVNGSPLSGRVITWSSSSTDVATVSQAGEVATHGVGAATIIATSEGASGSATVTVSPVPVATVAVQPSSASITVGSTLILGADIRDANDAPLDRAVTWSTDNSAVASVSASGVVTALTPGLATITATSEGKTGTSAVTVVPPAIASVTLQPDTASIRVGASTTLTPTVKDVTGAIVSDRDLTWTSSNVTVATVSTTGVVTGRAIGAAIISATSGGKSGSASVTVVAIPVGSVTVAPASATLVPTQRESLTAVVRDANGVFVTDRTVTWSSSNTAVAIVAPSGWVTAVAPGVATVTATSEGRSGSANISVAPMPVGSVMVNPASSTVRTGETTTLSATLRDTSGAVVTDRVVTWSSSDETIATVSSAGVVTGVSAGTATISATSEGKSGSSAVTVLPVPVATVSLEPASVRLEPGQTATIQATTKSVDGTVLTGRVVTFASDNVNVARVSSDGVVTGVAPGTATITATSEGRSAIAVVTVQPTVAYVIVAPSTVFLRRNGTVQLSVTAYDAAGREIVGRTVTWSTDDDHAATVSDTGLVTGRHAGTATISATIDGKTGSTRVTVTN